MSLERNITAENFPGEGVHHAILVDLTPLSGIAAGSYQTDIRDNVSGRVDATIVLRADDEALADRPGALAIVIESKLYGPAGEQQLEDYRKALEAKHIEVRRISVAWQEIYDLTRALPNEAEHDPIISDFKEFLSRDSRLTGFTGFKEGDFSPENYRLDDKLSRFCSQVLEFLKDDPCFRNASNPERKRGGLDYDFLLAKQNQLVGNLGIAAWNSKALSAKLVIGWRGRWQTDLLLPNVLNMHPSERADVDAIIDTLSKTGNVKIDAVLRPFFHRFDYDVTAKYLPTNSTDCKIAWDEIVRFSQEFHGKPLTKKSRSILASTSEVYDEERLDRALEQNVNCFVAPGIIVEWTHDALGKTPKRQIQIVSDTVRNLARLLYRFSSLPEPR
jgi:hypothetical protein